MSLGQEIPNLESHLKVLDFQVVVMKTLICILSKGLRRMTVKATAAGPDVEVAVEYSGTLDEWGTY